MLKSPTLPYPTPLLLFAALQARPRQLHEGLVGNRQQLVSRIYTRQFAWRIQVVSRYEYSAAIRPLVFIPIQVKLNAARIYQPEFT